MTSNEELVSRAQSIARNLSAEAAHERQVIYQLCDRIDVMERAKIAEQWNVDHAPKKAHEFLGKAKALMAQRGQQYDKPEGERSMGRAVKAFNAITGRSLSEAEGWLLLQVLKDVRQWQNPEKYHADSAEDGVAYSALKAEALAAEE